MKQTLAGLWEYFTTPEGYALASVTALGMSFAGVMAMLTGWYAPIVFFLMFIVCAFLAIRGENKIQKEEETYWKARDAEKEI